MTLRTNGCTWLICGGRNFASGPMFKRVMAKLAADLGLPTTVVHGGATGADAMADEWARGFELDIVVERPDWSAQGKAAGPIRNQKMLDEHSPNLVIAFPGGRGTSDMILRAKKLGTPLAEIALNGDFEVRSHDLWAAPVT